MARILVRRSAADAEDLAALYRSLAACIPKEEERAGFAALAERD